VSGSSGLAFTSALESRPPEHGSFGASWIVPSHKGYTLHEDYTRPTNFCLRPHSLQYFLLSMGLSVSTNSRRRPTGRIGQGAICGGCQLLRYASFSCYAYWFVSEHGPLVTDHVLRRFTSSMMIPFSMCFTCIAPFFQAKTRTTMPVTGGEMG
jgi:hypothetical protein